MPRAYISELVSSKATKQRSVKEGTSRREKTVIYHLPTGSSDNIKVCKKFFLGTLGITERQVRTAVGKRTAAGTAAADHLGHHGRSEEDAKKRSVIREHIDLFPRVKNHYIRRDSKRQYLSSELSVATMFKLFYKWLEEKGKMAFMSIYALYWQVFHQEFNLSFFEPEKDVCGLCQAARSEDVTETMKAEYDQHSRQKQLPEQLKLS